MIEKHYTKRASIYRMASLGGDKQGFTLLQSDIPCHVQPYNGENSMDIQGSFGKDFLLFTNSTVDIKDEDQIYIDDLKYRVTSVEKFAFLQKCRHQEVKIRVFE